MRISEKKIKRIINSYNLQSREDVINFIKINNEDLSIVELSRMAELVNNKRSDTAAYYSDPNIISFMYKDLPDFEKNVIRILEPSAGVGNFIDLLVEKYEKYEKVFIDLVDIDKDSLFLCEYLNNKKNIPENFEIKYFNTDFLKQDFNCNYDLIIGNPPFLKKNKIKNWKFYEQQFNDTNSHNISSFFIQKAINLSDYVYMIMPKYFLHNTDFKKARDLSKKYEIESIIDFGEKGFKGVLIETIALLINTKNTPKYTRVYSVSLDIMNKIKQEKMTDNRFPNWLLYRNEFFDKISKNLKFNVFTVFRDRSITNRVLNDNGDVRVLRSRNILRDGSGIQNIKGYDSYINYNDLKNHAIKKYLNNKEVFLCPNMTYYPRVIQKPDNCVTNGSVAILEVNSNIDVSAKHLEFLNSKEFTDFYKIARNYSTRSLNIDKNSVFYFGLIN
ncbi:Eco57I restriction-modification methylase domain-containing protein [Staphylococcus epidermidis]